MSIYEHPVNTLDGNPSSLADYQGRPVLIVNVASKCGLTPQYEQLQQLQDQYEDQNFTVLGVPCNQFMGQEPGTPEEIAEFCSLTYDVTFPLSEKVEVNGDAQHDLYRELNQAADIADGHTGDIRWNFEKFLVGADGNVVARFGPTVSPDDPEVISRIEGLLASAS
jgi:glutathione peroxidase